MKFISGVEGNLQIFIFVLEQFISNEISIDKLIQIVLSIRNPQNLFRNILSLISVKKLQWAEIVKNTNTTTL